MPKDSQNFTAFTGSPSLQLLNALSLDKPRGSYLRGAKHYALGVEASSILYNEYLDFGAIEDADDPSCAPHPSETYTVSLWTVAKASDPHSPLMEIIILVDRAVGSEERVVGFEYLPAGDAPPKTHFTFPMTRGEALRGRTDNGSSDKIPDDLRAHVFSDARLAWANLDAFRRLLARPTVFKLTEGRYERRTTLGGEKFTSFTPSAVVIDLDEVKRLYKHPVQIGARGLVGGHDFGATFAHRHLDPECEHVWERDDNPAVQHWRCACGGLRYYRSGGYRGDKGRPAIKRLTKIKKGRNDHIDVKGDQ